MVNNIILDLYSMAILSYILLLTNQTLEKDTRSSKLFRGMVTVTLVVLAGDAMSWFDGGTTPLAVLFVRIGNFVVFMLNTVVPTLYVLYVHDQIWQEQKRTFRWLPLLVAIYTLNFGLLVASQFTGWYYHIDAANTYHRGPLFFFSIAQLVLLILAPSLLVIRNRKRLQRNTLFGLSMFPVPPTICVLLQLLFYGVSLMAHGLTFSLLIVFLHIQNRHLHTDHLTGVFNRKKFEDVLKARIRESSGNHTFSAIMIDLDDFKEINDTYGHDIGDIALEEATRLMRSCMRTEDLIARIGGDEFAVILDRTTTDSLASTVQRIRDALLVDNTGDRRPFRLDFSMGYDTYDPDVRMEPKAFMKHLDRRMYEDKLRKRVRSALESPLSDK